eukprot:6197221-Pleurochrysis_carterae.AAC.2
MDLHQNAGLDNHDGVIVDTNSGKEVQSVGDNRLILLTLRNLLVQCFAQLGSHTGVVDPLLLDLRDIADQSLSRGWRSAELHVRTCTRCGGSGRHRERYGIALPVEKYLVAQKSQDGRRINRTLRRVSLHGGKLPPEGRDESGGEVSVEASATTTTASTSI